MKGFFNGSQKIYLSSLAKIEGKRLFMGQPLSFSVWVLRKIYPSGENSAGKRPRLAFLGSKNR